MKCWCWLPGSYIYELLLRWKLRVDKDGVFDSGGKKKAFWSCDKTGDEFRLFTCCPLSSGSRPGDTPTAAALRRCWAQSGRRREPPRNSPVRWSRRRCRRWRCCWSYPAGVAEGERCEKSASVQEELTGTKWRSASVSQGLQSRKETALWFIIITGSFWQLPSSSSRRLLCDPHTRTLSQSLVRGTWVVARPQSKKMEKKKNNQASSLCFQCI